MPDHPGTVLVVSGDLTRYADCVMAIMQTQKPPNTLIRWQKSCSVVDNLNNGIRAMQGDWVWIMGDDHVYHPDLLMRLLKHDVDFVAPLVCKRQWPFQLCAYSDETRPGYWRPVLRADLPPVGLYEAKAATNAGLLIRKRVLDAIGDPWFKHSGVVPGQIAEDVTFWKEARALGFKGYIDVEAKLGHVTPMTIWPSDGGEMSVQLEISPNVRTVLSFNREEVLDSDGRVMAARNAA